MKNKEKEIAILGAGPSGLVSAKEALAHGLKPTVLEAKKDIGGVWNSQFGAVWNSMRTNLSKFSCNFSDFPCSKEVDMFPKASEMFSYLKSYTENFGLIKHIRFDSKVTQVTPRDSLWVVKWVSSDNIHSKKVFDYVIVATGIFSDPYIPQISSLGNFTGQILHSKDYRNPEAFKDSKGVLVIGNSFSGTEIAAELSNYAPVIHHFHKPYWILKRYIPADFTEQFSSSLPLDLVFYNRKSYERPQASNSLTTSEINCKKNSYMQALCTQQEQIVSLKIKQEDFNLPPKVVISDDYINVVNKNKITLKKENITQFEHDKVVFDDQTEHSIDRIIFATGFNVNLSFLDKTILSQLKYQPQDQLQPIILYKCTFLHSTPNIAFVGIYRGPYFAVIELQAKWACKVFSGELNLPEQEEILKELKTEEQIRYQEPRPQFPHSDYVTFADSIAKEIGCYPDLEELRKENNELYKQFIHSPVIPAHFLIKTLKKDIAIKQINLLELNLKQLKISETQNSSISIEHEEKTCEPDNLPTINNSEALNTIFFSPIDSWEFDITGILPTEANDNPCLTPRRSLDNLIGETEEHL